MKKNTKPGLVKLLVISLIISIGILLVFKSIYKKPAFETIESTVKSADTKILADGNIRSQNEVNLHFAAGGKLVYLPFKEGDKVTKGATIASLDTYTIQKQLQLALNNYRSVRDSFDQVKDNNNDNYLKAQQANPYPYNYFNLGGIGGNTKDNAVNDMIKRVIDQAQAGLDNSVIQVELTNYAYTLSTLSAPFDGVITHLDVTTPNVIVSPQHSFIIIDPNAMVFRANILENDINFISEGSKASIQLTGTNDKKFEGIVIRIYPDKITLPTGQNVYQVDIDSPDLRTIANYKQNGSVLIDNKYDHQVILVPSWLILSKQNIWVIESNKPVLKTITTGKQVGDLTEVISGLTVQDKIITNPASIAGKDYQVL